MVQRSDMAESDALKKTQRAMCAEGVEDAFVSQRDALVDANEGMTLVQASRQAVKDLAAAAEESEITGLAGWRWVLANVDRPLVTVQEAPSLMYFTARLRAQKNPRFLEELLSLDLRETLRKLQKSGADRFEDDGRDIQDLCDKLLEIGAPKVTA